MTICYHNAYLEVSELKSQYVATMQRVERGIHAWSPAIAERLHNDLAFRASVVLREKDKQKGAKPETSSASNGKPDKPANKKSESKLPTDVKIHYCLDYQKGACPFKDNHEGKLGNKNVTLWHMCRRCMLSEAKLMRLHPESDEACPSRS